mmetsp:Transcript_36287/g.43836  ORF Transcript_36287/g.43836 Transcript_36287/m.43836 type:complete len:130 (-) Transcript_36287:634-1023(-)
MYRDYNKKGFVVLGFPCNQFGNQEPGSEQDIKKFAQKKYGVTFPLMSKVEVNGRKAHPVFKFLKSARPAAQRHSGTKPRDVVKHGGADVTWNFNKFLVDSTGTPLKRYPSAMDKEIIKMIRKDISGLLT